MTFAITSTKKNETHDGTLAEAIERAREINAEYAPAYGTQVADENGETVWDSEETHWQLDTENAGCDEVLVGDTYDEVLADVLHHHDIRELPEGWTITKMED